MSVSDQAMPKVTSLNRCGGGFADVRIVEAIHESAQTGRVMEILKLPSKRRPTLQKVHRPAHDKPKTLKTKSTSGEAA